MRRLIASNTTVNRHTKSKKNNFRIKTYIGAAAGNDETLSIVLPVFDSCFFSCLFMKLSLGWGFVGFRSWSGICESPHVMAT